MESRRAYTSGMVLVTAAGTRRRVPAGGCWIDRHGAAPGVCTVRWTDLGSDYSAQLSSDDMRAYVLGCIVQYA